MQRGIVAKKLLVAVIAGVVLVSLVQLHKSNELPVILSQGPLSPSWFIDQAISWMPYTGYVGLFVILLLESMSFPFPGELFIPLAGYYVFVGKMSAAATLGVCSLAGVLGSLLIYFLSVRFGAPLIYAGVTKFGTPTQKGLAKAEVRLADHGSAIVIVSRFIPLIGSAISLPAGALKMNALRFAGLSLVGSLASSLMLLLLGYVAGPVLQANEQFLSNLVLRNALYAIAIVVGIYVAYYLLKASRAPKRKVGQVSKEVAARRDDRFVPSVPRTANESEKSSELAAYDSEGL